MVMDMTTRSIVTIMMPVSTQVPMTSQMTEPTKIAMEWMPQQVEAVHSHTLVLSFLYTGCLYYGQYNCDMQFNVSGVPSTVPCTTCDYV